MCGIIQFSAKLNKIISILNLKTGDHHFKWFFFLIGPPIKVTAYHQFKPIQISLNQSITLNLRIFKLQTS